MAAQVVHEGQRIRELLASIGKTPADLARACDVSRTAVDRYLKSEEIGKIAWVNLRPGLVRLGIDPRKVKPDDRVIDAADVDLRPLLQGFDAEQLARIKKMVEADDGPREKLVYYLDGHLKALRKR